MTVGENSFFLKVTLSFASKLGKGVKIEDLTKSTKKIKGLHLKFHGWYDRFENDKRDKIRSVYFADLVILKIKHSRWLRDP